MTSQRWIWGMALGTMAAAGLGMLLLKKEPPAPTPLMMAAVAPTTPPAEPINPPAAESMPPLSPEDAEKLKEVATYRNEEFGFAFQHPKYRRVSFDGRLMEVHEYRHDPVWEPRPLELTLMGVKLAAIKKSADFSTLRLYIDTENKRIEQIAKEDSDPLCFDEKIHSIQVANREAFLEECISSGHPESTIYIEANEYVYHLFFLGHLNEASHDPDIRQGLQFVRMLLETWTFSEDGHE